MEERINEMKTMLKQAISAGMKKVQGMKAKKAAKAFDANQIKASAANAKLRSMFDPKSSYKPTGKSNLEKPRSIKAQLAINKAKV